MDTFTFGGREFSYTVEPDDISTFPWEDCDGHGPVRVSHKKDKRPGERPLNNPGWHESYYYYDWQEAAKRARREGWNAPPYDAPNKIQRAVQADFDYCRQWVSGYWWYALLSVSLLNDDGEKVDTLYLGGIETNNGDVDTEYLHELADELLHNEERRAFPVASVGV